MSIQILFGNAADKPGTHKPVSAVGIDLGTTNSLVAYVGADGTPQVVVGPDGAMVPSVIAFGADGELASVGRAALEGPGPGR